MGLCFRYQLSHIWACPPSEGDDYIFHCHPLEQKIPKHKRLVDWYKKMLDKALQDGVIVEYKVSFELLTLKIICATAHHLVRKTSVLTVTKSFDVSLT